MNIYKIMIQQIQHHVKENNIDIVKGNWKVAVRWKPGVENIIGENWYEKQNETKQKKKKFCMAQCILHAHSPPPTAVLSKMEVI